MTITRRRFAARAAIGAAVAVAVPALLTGRARAAEFSLKYANNLPAAHPVNARAAEAAAKIKSDSKGRVEIGIFPNSQLGGDTDMLSQLRTGAIDYFTLSGLILATVVPVASINGIGFAFKSYDRIWAAMDGELGAHVRGAIARAGLHSFDKVWDNGYRQITSSTKPINTPDDLKGFRIRVPVSPLWTSMFKAFAASPRSINFSEVFSALQTRIVEGQENPLAIIETARLYQVQKYCSLTNHMWDGFWMLANAASWRKLPPTLQEIVARNFNEAALSERSDLAKLNASLADSLEGKGMLLNTPETEPFRAALRKAGFYAKWKRKHGDAAWAILEKYAGSLA
jgi:TRAP-type transport system periplasmic protein